MNIVKILLVIGLGYVAMTQKSEKTRNMLLVVTGLLAFCMFSMEGFTVTFNDLTGFSGSDQTVSERTITVGSDAATQIVYTLPSSGTTYNSESPIPSTGYSCTIGGTTGVMGKYTGADVQAVDITDSSSGGSFDITKIFTCAAAETTSQSCSAGETAGKSCPPYYTVKTGNCEADPCVDAEFTATGVCCDKLCSDTDCNDWKIFGIGSGERQECKEEFAGGFLKYYCNEGS